MPKLLQYPSNLAISVGEAASGGESLDGYYGHWMLITIYEPEKTTTARTEADAKAIAGKALGAIATPFVLEFLGVGGGVNTLATTGLIGALGISNLDEEQFQVATSGRQYDNSTLDNLERSGDNKTKELANKIRQAKGGRVPDTRVTLGLGLRYKKSDISIALPMPKQIKSNYGFEYSETDFSSMKVINSMIAYVKSKSDATENNPMVNRSMELSSPDVQGALSFLETLPAAALDEGFKLLGLQPNLLDYTRAGKNQAKVPYSEKLFKSVKRRSFEVDYKFLPKNQQEVFQIHEIIKTLKANAHPSLGSDSYYYTTPSEFVVDFQFLGSRNSFLPKFGRLAIESIDVDYGSSNGFSTLRPTQLTNFDQGDISGVFNTGLDMSFVSPTEINLKISFTELELLTKERIEEGY